MSVTTIKDPTSNNQLKVNTDGSINTVPSSSIGANVSIVEGGNTAKVTASGALDVNVVSGGAKNISLVYNEITNVSPAVESTIVVYNITTDNAQLINVAAAGGNIGEVKVYRNTDVIDKQYLSYTLFNLSFNFFNLDLLNGDVITVKGINSGTTVSNFNAKIQIVETV